MVPISRRDVLKYAAAIPAAALAGAVSAAAPRANAASLGTLIDYAGGVPTPESIKAAGHLGAIRYVSDPRSPGLSAGKPIKLAEARDLYRAGLKIVSNYQYGKQDTADWLGGHDAGIKHAQRGWQLHIAAGGSYNVPIYVSIDDNPTPEQYKNQVAPYLKAWETVLGHQRTGLYGNSKTIDWALQDGLCSYFWQHNWGVPRASCIPRHIYISSRSTSVRSVESASISMTS